MHETVNINSVIKASPDKVWEMISAIGGLDQWFPIIESCNVEGEGEGVGATRICVLGNGATLYERVEEIDHEAKRFCYTITESPMPISNYLGTVKLDSTADGNTELTWSAEFDVDEEHREEMSAMMNGALAEGVKGLTQFLEG
jgi:uncharacterized protein YndB with AHSA1/START domain